MAAIDDYLFDEWGQPRKADAVSKVNGDFRGVNDTATYAKAFADSSKRSNALSEPP